jgi:hypothetical protein
MKMDMLDYEKTIEIKIEMQVCYAAHVTAPRSSLGDASAVTSTYITPLQANCSLASATDATVMSD